MRVIHGLPPRIISHHAAVVTPHVGPPGKVSVPPASPDYSTLLQSDPNYLAWQANSVGNLSNAATARKAAIRALVGQYGGLPADFTDTYGDLTPGDLQIAGQNPYSVEASLSRAYHGNVMDMKKQLAARGALHSGDLGFQQGQLDTSYGQQQYDAGRQFSSQLQDSINAYLQAAGQDRQDQTDAISRAYQDMIANPAYQPTAGSASLVPHWKERYGVPVYRAADGRLYAMRNGKPVPYASGG